MECVYNIEDCDHTKCSVCNNCTRGSQIHRNCLQFEADKNEVSDLLASDSESLPTEEMEQEAESVRTDTPLSAKQYFEMVEAELEDYIWDQEMLSTSVDIVYPYLRKNYPDENFNSMLYVDVSLHRYLSENVTKKEFYVMTNQWHKEAICHHDNDRPIRMRKGVHERMGKLWHIGCIDDDSEAYRICSFTHGIITVEARNCDEFITLMLECPDYFFCDKCDYYLFDGVNNYNEEMFKRPETGRYSKCDKLKNASILNNTNDQTYATVECEKLIAIVYPQVADE